VIENSTLVGALPGITTDGTGTDIRFTFSEATFLAIKEIESSD